MSGFLSRLRTGLSRSAARLKDGIAALVGGRRLDPAVLSEIEELLIAADLGVATAGSLVEGLRKLPPDSDEMAVRLALADAIATILAPVARPLSPDPAHKPHVVLMVGVNGTGKTTSIGKLAKAERDAGRAVWLAAGDTFRAAAVEQLSIWGERVGAPVVRGAERADPASLAFDALSQARAAGADLLLIDTAGRLHNKSDLMAELQKIVRVIRKVDARAPHDTLLTLDATTGQNAHAQVETFKSMAPLTGLVLTKLDGTAKGGVVVGLAARFGLPIVAVGVGEGADDLRPFDPTGFARGLVGLD